MPKTLYSLLNPKTLRIADLMIEDGEGGMDARVNAANRQVVVDSWNLGPEEASVDPAANGEYWRKMADLWMIEEPEARRRFPLGHYEPGNVRWATVELQTANRLPWGYWTNREARI
jgi:hypothetical protein